MDSPVSEELAGATNALIIGFAIVAAGVGVLLWVGRQCVRAVVHSIRQRIHAAMSKRDKGSP